MRRTVAVAATSAALLLSGAAPALAQYPGTNGTLITGNVGDPSSVPCLTYTKDYIGNGDNGTMYLDGGVAASPDGKHLAAVVYDADTSSGDIYINNATGTCGTPRFLYLKDPDPDVDGAESGGNISWSPDSTQLVVTAYNGFHVKTYNATTGALVHDLGVGEEPTWDPKASTIAYTDDTGLRTVPSKGGTSKLLVRSPNVSRPDYSPDGTKLAYVQAPDMGSGRIAYVTLSTGKVTVTPVSTQDRFTWSPDGKDFAVTSTATGEATIVTTGGKVVSRPGGGSPLAWEAKH